MQRTMLRRYSHTWSPRYDPARIAIPDSVPRLLEHYSALAKAREARPA